jgi:hypothetical protein
MSRETLPRIWALTCGNGAEVAEVAEFRGYVGAGSIPPKRPTFPRPRLFVCRGVVEARCWKVGGCHPDSHVREVRLVRYLRYLSAFPHTRGRISGSGDHCRYPLPRRYRLRYPTLRMENNTTDQKGVGDDKGE